MASRHERYETIRDYVLLTGGSVLLLASIGLGIAGNTQLGVAFLGGALTCWGLVPSLARDRNGGSS